MNGPTEQELERLRHTTATRLSAIYKDWTVREDGLVLGPGTLAVRVEDHHRVAPNHVDMGFVLNRDRSDVPILWDCAAGWGSTNEEALDGAVETWAASTLPVFLEFLNQGGSFADHYPADDPEGCLGWHVIHGPVYTFGEVSDRKELQTWVLENPMLPTVGHLAAARFDRSMLNTVKLLFGSAGTETAEVRINGECDERVSDALRSLNWPRSKQAAFARIYLLFVHFDGTQSRKA